MLSPEEVQSARTQFGITPVSSTPTVDRGAELDAAWGNTQPTTQSRVIGDIKTAGGEVQSAISGEGQYAEQSPLRRGVEAVATAASTVPKVASEFLPEVARTGLAKVGEKVGGGASNVINWLGDKIGDTQMAQDLVTKYPKVAHVLEEVAGIAGAGTEIAGNIVGAKAGIGGVAKATEVAKPFVQAADLGTMAKTGVQATKDLYSAITTNSPEKINAYITTKFEKGVKPSVAGKGTSEQVSAYQDKALQAVKTIVDNKSTLKLTDEFGEPTGKLPQNLKQFADTIDQTKKQIFAKYDALQKSAGETGAKVDLNPTVNELRTVQNNPTVQDLHPELAKYAESRANALEARGIYDTQSAQDAITSLNTSLQAFYKNPSYETASKAGVDAMIANKLRSGLDDVIEKTTGADYQDLKNQYGALKTIEKDVVHRAIVDGRKNTVGLMGSIGDIASGAELVRGLLTMNPADLAISGTIKGISMYQKYLNNPNTAIRRLFEAADSQATKASAGGLPSTAKDLVPTVEGTASPNPTIPSPKEQGEIPKTTAPTFAGFKDITTKILDRLKGKSVTSKQEILDFTNMADVKQPEKDLIRKIAEEYKGQVPVQEFANKVKTELLPLKRVPMNSTKFNTEGVVLPNELRGPVANYQDHVYESPIKTSAGDVHGYPSDKMFAHTRIEDLPNPKLLDEVGQPKDFEYMTPAEQKLVQKNGGVSDTRRVIELQSDLFQKGRLEEGGLTSANKADEIMSTPSREVTKNWTNKDWDNLEKQREKAYAVSKKEMSQLEPYRNTWHERVIREEVKQAAKDGKTKLQFPTGETAMKIEGLGDIAVWTNKDGINLTHTGLKQGDEVRRVGTDGNNWIITDVLGDGKFKAVPKDKYDALTHAVFSDYNQRNLTKGLKTPQDIIQYATKENFNYEQFQEQFDISGKVDTNNPIYRFYEKEVGRYLQNKYGATQITDPQGVKWWQVNVPKEAKRLPIEAFAVAPLLVNQNQEQLENAVNSAKSSKL